jgi:hypothetical protein
MYTILHYFLANYETKTVLAATEEIVSVETSRLICVTSSECDVSASGKSGCFRVGQQKYENSRAIGSCTFMFHSSSLTQLNMYTSANIVINKK